MTSLDIILSILLTVFGVMLGTFKFLEKFKKISILICISLIAIILFFKIYYYFYDTTQVNVYNKKLITLKTYKNCIDEYFKDGRFIDTLLKEKCDKLIVYFSQDIELLNSQLRDEADVQKTYNQALESYHDVFVILGVDICSVKLNHCP